MHKNTWILCQSQFVVCIFIFYLKSYDQRHTAIKMRNPWKRATCRVLMTINIDTQWLHINLWNIKGSLLVDAKLSKPTYTRKRTMELSIVLCLETKRKLYWLHRILYNWRICWLTCHSNQPPCPRTHTRSQWKTKFKSAQMEAKWQCIYL